MAAHSVVLAGAGTTLSGIGFGASALAVFGTLARIAAPNERGELFAFGYVVAYLAFSIPAVLAGIASGTLGLQTTALVYGLGVVGLSLAALVAQRIRSAPRRQPASGGINRSSDLPLARDSSSAACRLAAAPSHGVQ